MTPLARLKQIARRHDILEAAEAWHKTMQHTPDDAVAFASCVCAAAFDAHRKTPRKANAICDEVWSDSDLVRERVFRDKRDAALEIFDDFKCGPFVALDIRNRYDHLLCNVEVELQCCRCGRRRSGNAVRIATLFGMQCPACGAVK